MKSTESTLAVASADQKRALLKKLLAEGASQPLPESARQSLRPSPGR